MRSITDIKKEMTSNFVNKDEVKTIYGISKYTSDTQLNFDDHFSRYSIESIIFYIVACCAWVLEGLFDQLKTDVNETISLMKPHSLQWYAEKAKMYQHGDGYHLLLDSDKYDNEGKTGIEASKVVKYSAVTEMVDIYHRHTLYMKLANSDGNKLNRLDTAQLDGVRAYFERIKDAGVMLVVNSYAADLLKMDWTIYYDPMILNSQGARLDGTDNTPVQNAINKYLQNLPFNGIFVPQYLTDAVQAVEGVVICKINTCHTKTQSSVDSIFTILQNETYIPDAGYLQFEKPDDDLTIRWEVQNAIR